MKKLLASSLLFASVILSSAAQEPAKKKAPASAAVKAMAVLHPTGSSQATGIIVFTQRSDHVDISGEIVGLTRGLHGFHVHQYGDCSAADGSSAGAHFNPTGMPHGNPNDARRHVGDLGNIEADHSGRAIVRRKDRVIQLQGPHAIVGRSLIVHADPDDSRTQPSGNAGARLACGVIGIANPSVMIAPVPKSRPIEQKATPKFLQNSPLRVFFNRPGQPAKAPGTTTAEPPVLDDPRPR